MGQEIVGIIERINGVSPKWNVLGYYDDFATIVNGDMKVLGVINDLINSEVCAVIVIANPDIRM